VVNVAPDPGSCTRENWREQRRIRSFLRRTGADKAQPPKRGKSPGEMLFRHDLPRTTGCPPTLIRY
jgi:hypothetical protein